MNKTSYLALVLLAFSIPAFAVDSGAVVGGAAGAAAGAVVGKKVGGDNGAVLGAAIGAATGVAIGGKDQPAQAAPVKAKTEVPRQDVAEGDRHEHHDNGRHLGERKDKHKNKNKEKDRNKNRNKHEHND